MPRAGVARFPPVTVVLAERPVGVASTWALGVRLASSLDALGRERLWHMTQGSRGNAALG